MIIRDLDKLLHSLPDVRAGVIGDYCLDVYWTIDESVSENSVETGLATRPIHDQRYSLGGAGTVVNNLIALKVGHISVFGVIGNDPFGREMLWLMKAGQLDHTGMLTQAGDWDTPVYLKPHRDGREDNRIDFGNFNQLSDQTATALIAKLAAAIDKLDIVIVNQQLIRGIHTTTFQRELNALIRQRPDKQFIVDCRHFSGIYTGCMARLNAFEATRQCGAKYEPRDLIPLDEVCTAAETLYKRSKQPVFVSRGARGVLVADKAGVNTIPGIQIIGSTDPVGAGDAMLAGAASALAAGRTPLEAATFGNFVSAVTVQKLFQTGTASPDEVRAIGTSPDYIYEPELADDPRHAKYWKDTEIEIVQQLPEQLHLTYAIFDHDGTISTLREGWEQVMEPMMIKAILGEQYAKADETLYARVSRRVREFIDQTTGVQVLVQMLGLVRLVREFGVVTEKDILDEFRYKKIYTDALNQVVRARLEKLQRSELNVSDFTMKNVVELLSRLRAAGVKLHLASGTDVEDVRQEAEALGYASMFEGRIYGGVGDVTKEAKRIVLDRILSDIGAANVTQVVTFGDGPVEIRETRKRGGLTVGIDSDEVRRYGSNPTKRSRVIRAGANIVIHDFSQLDALFALLQLR